MNVWIKLQAHMIFSLRNTEEISTIRKKYKVLIVQYQIDNDSNEKSYKNKRNCQYYKHVDM